MGEQNGFTKFQYREAQAFLKDARRITFWNTNFYTHYAEWVKPDGSMWEEYERKLEGSEWEYHLIRL